MKEGFDINIIPSEILNSFEEKYSKIQKEYPNLISKKESRIKLTTKGMLMSDQIIPELIFSK